ncbi:hypothetical protein CYMTET_11859 [Cymbomonas tetramitiformis]|uniref:Uncharacterized protein n=1 Tax=Cymbomonas tetramitiformis TaxID=36881 RepID=A0AAE0LCF2_9CHLO|nr:hypothetical protein CYMTET_11859 [Cymbomonas tetramitiformis]
MLRFCQLAVTVLSTLLASSGGVRAAYVGSAGLPTSEGVGTNSNFTGYSKHVGEYPACKPSYVDGTENLLAYAIDKLTTAPTFAKPFPFSTYFCEFWPRETYEQMTRYFPPDAMFDNYKAKQKGCGKGGCRYQMEHTSILKADPAAKQSLWPQIVPAQSFWRNITSVVFSRSFEQALWRKLKIKGPIKRRELRILSDKNGWANGRIHTDMQARKVATMMFYLPSSDGAKYDYGTCLHTFQQYKHRVVQKKGLFQTTTKHKELNHPPSGTLGGICFPRT